MGAVTRIQSAVKMPAGRSRRYLGRLRCAGLVLAAASAFTSAKASAGLVALTPQNSSPAMVDASNRGMPTETKTIDGNLIATESGSDNLLWNDPLSFAGATDKPTAMRGWNFVDPTSQVRNATPTTTATPPLLIPLPTGISAGAIGLVAMALILAPRRVRRLLLG